LDHFLTTHDDCSPSAQHTSELDSFFRSSNDRVIIFAFMVQVPSRLRSRQTMSILSSIAISSYRASVSTTQAEPDDEGGSQKKWSADDERDRKAFICMARDAGKFLGSRYFSPSRALFQKNWIPFFNRERLRR